MMPARPPALLKSKPASSSRWTNADTPVLPRLQVVGPGRPAVLTDAPSAGADLSFTALVADELSHWMDEIHRDGGLAATPDSDALGAAGWRHDWMS